MGTHPIFESDFDCLTDMDENLLGCYIKDSKGQLGSFRVKQEVLNRRKNIYTSRPKVRREKFLRMSQITKGQKMVLI